MYHCVELLRLNNTVHIHDWYPYQLFAKVT